MADLGDPRFETLLRRTLREDADARPVSLRPDDILVRRARRDDAAGRAGRRRWPRILLVAAMLLLPLGALLAVARPSVLPPLVDPYRAVLVRGLAPDATTGVRSDLEVVLAGPDGRQELIAQVSAARLPDGIRFPDDVRVTASGSLDLTAVTDSRVHYVAVDLAHPERDPVVTLSAPNVAPDLLRSGRSPEESPVQGELRICPMGPPTFRRPCGERTDRAIESGPVGGETHAWLPRAPEGLSYVSPMWAADGGIWVLADDRRGGRRAISLLHVAPGGAISTTERTFGRDPGTPVGLGSMAPDESLAVLPTSGGAGAQTILVRPATGQAILVDGSFAGFADPATAAALPRDGRPLADVPQLPASAAPYRTLDPIAEQLGMLPPGRPILVREGHSRGGDATFDSGPITYSEHWAASLFCAGSGRRTWRLFDVAGSEDSGWSGSNGDCLYRNDGYATGPDPDRPALPPDISASIQTSGEVAWRLIVIETDVPPGAP